MIINGKYYVPPPGDDSDFKELFRRMVREGAGRPVDKAGVPEGPWTPRLLTDALAQIEDNHSTIDLRSVQRWFRDDDRGIKTDNIRWLAWIFGCGEPEYISKWQAELSRAQSRLAAKKRKKVTAQNSVGSETPVNDPTSGKIRFSLAKRSEALFHGRSSLNLPIAVWACCGLLWFLAYIFGVHSVTYSPIEGLSKQVGFFWSPAWNVGELVFLPVFLIIVTELLNFWRNEGRSSIVLRGQTVPRDDAWTSKIESFWLSYWAIFFICFVGIFFVQWSGVYLRSLLQGNSDITMVDWILVALVRPDVISIGEAIWVSLLAFLYSGMIYWFFFLGLLLLYTIANDFSEVCGAKKLEAGDAQQGYVCEVGTQIMRAIFRGTILGCLIAVCIKLNAAYLISDAEGIASWLINDTLYALGLSEDQWDWIDPSPSPFFTSFLLLFLTCFVFFACLAQIFWALERTLEGRDLRRQVRVIWLQMIGVVVLLAVSFLFIGQFSGFSILLVVGVSVAVGSLIGRWRVQGNREEQ